MATLLKIANEKYIKNVSHDKGFSLNGSLRNKSYVGQTSLARKINKTYFTRYHEPAGKGGCCGDYNDRYTEKSRCCINDNNIIKKSVSNTKAMINRKNKWMNSGYPYYVVQPDSNLPLNSSTSSYINCLKLTTIADGMKCVENTNETIDINNNSSQKRFHNLSSCCNIPVHPPRVNNTLCFSKN